MKFFRENRGFILALIIIGAFLYLFNLKGPLFWDDADWILDNFSVHALTWANIKFIFSHDVLAGIGQVSNYYRPFLFLTFLLNYLITGTNPILYHVVSDAIHIANAILLFYLLSRWLRNNRAAFLASLLFLIQPIQTEAVAYVSGRGDPLSIFFILLGITLFLNGKRWWAGILAALAILSRETAVLFPIYLGLALIAFEYSSTIWPRFKSAFRAILPYLGISAVYGVLRLTVLNFQDTLNFYQHQNIYSSHLSYRIYTFFHALLVYIRLAFWPIGLHMERDIPVSIDILAGWAWLGLLVIICLLGWLVWLYRSDKRYLFSVWFFGVGIFFINLAPTSGIVPINARIYEHWAYFSLAGLFTIVAVYLDRIWAWCEHRRILPLFVILFVAYCTFFGIQTIRRNIIWTDPEELYKNILYYEPKDVRILNNLGMIYSNQHDYESAIPMFSQAIDSDPTQPAPYYNLGNIATDVGDFGQAETLYKKAIEASPSFYYAYRNLAALYAYEKRLPEALDLLQKLEQIYPSEETEKNIQALQHALGR